MSLREFKEALQNCQALGRIRHWQSPGMPELEAVSMGGGINAGSLAVADPSRKQVAAHAAFTRDTQSGHAVRDATIHRRQTTLQLRRQP
ncbi:MAG: hypothetical protein WA129_00180 [Acidovorax sp.]